MEPAPAHTNAHARAEELEDGLLRRLLWDEYPHVKRCVKRVLEDNLGRKEQAYPAALQRALDLYASERLHRAATADALALRLDMLGRVAGSPFPCPVAATLFTANYDVQSLLVSQDPLVKRAEEFLRATIEALAHADRFNCRFDAVLAAYLDFAACHRERIVAQSPHHVSPAASPPTPITPIPAKAGPVTMTSGLLCGHLVVVLIVVLIVIGVLVPRAVPLRPRLDRARLGMGTVVVDSMGTRSRLHIKRRKHADVYLWAHWDGHFDGVGKTLCEQLRVLLADYTQAELCAAVEGLRVTYRDQTVYDPTLYQSHSFDFAKLADALRGPRVGVGAASAAASGGGGSDEAASSAGVVYNDPCTDVEYKYTLDLYTGVLLGESGDWDTGAVILTLAQLRAGVDFWTACISNDDAKLKILDVCRVNAPAGTDFDARTPSLVAAIDTIVSSEGTYCLSAWSEEEWLRQLK